MSNANESAYPRGEHGTALGGLTKRELFAAMAMQGLLSCVEERAGPQTVGQCEIVLGLKPCEYRADVHYPMLVAMDACKYADALLAALEQPTQGEGAAHE